MIREIAVGQHSGNSSFARGGHPVGNFVESIAEEVAVLVQRHGRRGVPEHLLDDLHVGSGRDGQRRSGVPQLVRVQARFADRSCGSIEGGIAEDRPAQRDTGSRAREHEITGLLAGNVLLELVEQEERYRDLTALMALRRPVYKLRTHQGDRLGDDGPAAEEVETANPQRGQFAEAQSGVGEEQDDQPVVVAAALGESPVLTDDVLTERRTRLGEILDLFVGQVLAFSLDHARQIHTGGDVARQPPVLDRHREDQRQHAMHLPHGGRRT